MESIAPKDNGLLFCFLSTAILLISFALSESSGVGALPFSTVSVGFYYKPGSVGSGTDLYESV
jgi:hypothetical protein